jgi:hypothetical protein
MFPRYAYPNLPSASPPVLNVLEEGLTILFLNDPIISALAGTRIYGSRIKQGSTFPCLTKQRIDTPRIHTMDESGATGSLAHPRFQIDAWGTTEASVKALTDAVRAALNGKTGSLGPGAISIRSALVQDEVLDYDPETDLYRSRSDYEIWQEE